MKGKALTDRLRRRALGTALTCAYGLALAQVNPVPEAGSILRDIERQQRVLPRVPAPHAVPAKPAEKPDDDVRFVVRTFRLTGVSLLPEADVQAVLAPWLGKEIGFSDLERALQAISDLYVRHGWFARPQLPVQDIGADGTVSINVIEARLGAIRFDEESGSRLDRSRALGTMTARQQSGEPLSLTAMDRSINLLNDLPGVAAKATLAASDAESASDIVLKIDDKGILAGTVSLDNTGSRSTGAARASVNASLDNLSGFGDQVMVNLAASEGTQYLRLGYTLPVGYDGLRLGVNASDLSYHLVGSFSSVRAEGTARTVGLTASYPLRRTSTGKVNAFANFDTKHFHNEANGAVTSQKAVRVAGIGLSGDEQDGVGQGGMSFWNISLTFGRLDLSGNAANEAADQSGPRASGGYSKLSATLSRLQRLTDDDSLWLSYSPQKAFKNLDSSEQFSLGGAQGVRAYPVSEASGDTGWLTTVEWRHSFTPELQQALFYDYGDIRLHHNGSYVATGGTPNHYALKGFGTSLAYTVPGRYSLRLTLARRIGANAAAHATTGADGDGSRLLNRVWLSGIAYF